MSSSRTRNFRRRGTDDDGDSSNVNDNSSSTTTSIKKPTPQLSKPKKLLSFADDEEGEEDIQKSSNKIKTKSRDQKSVSSSRLSKTSTGSSHKIVSSRDRLQQPPHTISSTSNVQPQAGTYTKETLLELQKNTKTLATPSSKQQQVSSTAEPKIVLKGLLKPVDSNPLKEQSPSDDSDSDPDDTEARLAAIGIGRSKDSPLVLDRATIEAIKAKRERLRQSRGGAGADYISLDTGSEHRGGASQGGFSDEEPEFPERMAMVPEKVKGVFEEVEEETKRRVEEEDDEDEVAKMWEEEQARKGLGRKRLDDGPLPPPPSRVATSNTNVGMQPPPPPPPPPIPSIGGAMGGFENKTIAQIGEDAMKALRLSFSERKEFQVKKTAAVMKINEDLSTSLLNIAALESALSAAGEKYIFMQKLREFVTVICDFLQHRASYIEELEEHMQKLNEERASTVLERRAADVADELMEVEAAVKAAMAVFSERGNSAAAVANAKSAAQAAITAFREKTSLSVKLDEFGRDVNLQKRMDMTRRAEARQRRRARFDSKQLSSMDVDNAPQKMEGESSTDESDSESSAYLSTRKSLLECVDSVLTAEALDEYSQLSSVKQRFEEWKRDYTPSYRDAYMSLSLPEIMSPYVRVELQRWDPLHEDTDFSEMKWHSLLFNYGLSEDGKDFANDDADANLVPTLVEKVALPILHHQIVKCWDMLSTQETKNAVSATSLVIAYVPTSSKALAELLKAIRTRLAEAVKATVVPTWSPLAMNAVPNAARIAAYRFGMAVRLMRNICLWKEILAMPILEELALDGLLYRKVLPHVRSITSNIHDAITRSERVVASLSGVWAGSSMTGSRSRKLQPLVDYVLSLGKAFEKKRLGGVSESETGGLARRLKKILVELNEYDSARDIARTFHLKEAL